MAKCPYLEEVKVAYCQAFPVKKMIPANDHSSPCNCGQYQECPVFQSATPKPLATPPKGTRQQPSQAAKASPRIASQAESTGSSPTAGPQPGEQNYCIWMSQRIVSFMLCTRNYECESCAFHQMIEDRDDIHIDIDPKNFPEMQRLIAEMKKKPAAARKCKYMFMGKIYTEPCLNNYQCWECERFNHLKSKLVLVPTEAIV